MSAGHDMTCGTCGRTWNSEETPTPAARCPYEYEHAEEPEDEGPLLDAETARTIADFLYRTPGADGFWVDALRDYARNL